MTIGHTYAFNQHGDYLLKVSLTQHNTREREKQWTGCLADTVNMRNESQTTAAYVHWTGYRFFTPLDESANARNETQTKWPLMYTGLVIDVLLH